jgi:hypothetical protein
MEENTLACHEYISILAVEQTTHNRHSKKAPEGTDADASIGLEGSGRIYKVAPTGREVGGVDVVTRGAVQYRRRVLKCEVLI